MSTAGTRVWVRAVVQDPTGARVIPGTGRQVVPVVPSLALVALAGAVVVLLGSRWTRLAAAAVLTLAGAAAAGAAVQSALVPQTTVAPVVAERTGRQDGGAIVSARTTSWAWLAGGAGALVGLGGLGVAVSTLPRAHRRHPGGTLPEAARPARPPPDLGAAGTDPSPPPAPAEAWDALSRGHDPT
jgi:hypothetical protein